MRLSIIQEPSEMSIRSKGKGKIAVHYHHCEGHVFVDLVMTNMSIKSSLDISFLSGKSTI